jgi:hypothetical protein
VSRPHIRTEWPWIRSAPLFKVHTDASHARIDLDVFVTGSTADFDRP